MEKEVFDWREAYIKKHYDQCSYLPLNFCGVAIKGVAETTGNHILNEMRAETAYPSMATAQIMIRHTVDADKKGKAIVLESKVAAIDIYGKDLFRTYEPIWAHDCADQLRRTRIHALGDAYVKVLMARQKAHPNAERNQMVFEENTQVIWPARAGGKCTPRRSVPRDWTCVNRQRHPIGQSEKCPERKAAMTKVA